ncbi:MAG: bifunctional diaminohydroxyphosphoribosylaminopyrimidine deaminase/5-amino-6-(5-phosphoribosylamino)uracil reductase RibD [Ornithinimicrobium sp.]
MDKSGAAAVQDRQLPGAAEDVVLLRRCVNEALAGPQANPNPRVGAVIVDAEGEIVGIGHHLGAGTPHAEVEALAVAGTAAAGGTAYVSLEPCAHHGRTPPCTQALHDAGVTRVVFAHADPDARAAGGAAWLSQRGVAAHLLPLPEAEELVRHWSFAITHGRPWVTWKYAATLDGRIAAADGSSAWITSASARADVHLLRSQCGAIVVGTGTALADRPSLTARREDESLYAEQPLRVVVGRRDLPPDLPAEPLLQVTDRDPIGVVATLHTRGVRRVLVEGGPTLAAQWWQAGLVDEVVAYLAPALLGSGAAAVGDLGIASMADIARLEITDMTLVGPDVRITARPAARPSNDQREA